MTHSNMTSTELRNILSDENPGRSTDVRSFVKKEHIFMLDNDISLDEMISRRESAKFPYKSMGDGNVRFDPKKSRDSQQAQDSFDDVFTDDYIPEPAEPKAEPKQAPKSKPSAAQNGQAATGTGGLEDVIIGAIMSRIDLNSIVRDDDIEAMVSKKVAEGIKDVRTIEWEVKDLNGNVKKAGLQHKTFGDLVKIAGVGAHVLLVGEAGSGKSRGTEEMADALDLDFYSLSVNPQTTKVDFFGYMDATGNYVETGFYRAVKYGGVFLADEIDAGNPSILTAINAVTGGNTFVSFPHEMVEVHEDFIFVGAANTYGRGADRQYVGRNQLDAATLDRFITLEWGYDENLEREIAGNDEWVSTVQAIRKGVNELGIRHVVSPRASVNGSKLLQAGFSRDRVLEMTVFKGLDKSSRESLLTFI